MKNKSKQFTKNVQNIAKLTGKPTSQIYDYIAGRLTVGKNMAVTLGSACDALSINCPKEMWAWGRPEERRSALNYQK